MQLVFFDTIFQQHPNPELSKYWFSESGHVVDSNGIPVRLYHSGDYKTIRIRIKGKDTHFYVHRLIAEIFIPNPNNCDSVRFSDGNKRNINAENLYWANKSDPRISTKLIAVVRKPRLFDDGFTYETQEYASATELAAAFDLNVATLRAKLRRSDKSPDIVSKGTAAYETTHNIVWLGRPADYPHEYVKELNEEERRHGSEEEEDENIF